MKTTNQKGNKTGSKKTKPRTGSSKKTNVSKQKSYQVISKKNLDKGKDDKNIFSKSMKIVTQFFKEAKMELKKVKWPTRKELIASTAMVLFLVIAIAFYLGLIDFGLIKVIKNIIG